MVDLNNPSTFKHLDPKDVFGSTGLLEAQCKQVVQDFKKIKVPNDYKNIKNIVISGMGGSSYGGHVALSLLKDQLSIPLYVNNDYFLPGFVNEQSLVILISYSGSTEETLASSEDAKKRGAKIAGLTSGGKLGDFLKTSSDFYYIFDPKNNPSGQPRLGTGYTVLGTLLLLDKLGIGVSFEQVDAFISELDSNTKEIKNTSIEFAKKLQGNIPLIFAADFLEGNAHIIRNQFNETSKTFSAFSPVPELNHHLMEGLKYPKDKKLKVLFLESDLYSDIYKKRLKLTQDVISKNQIEFISFRPHGSSKISQVLATLSFGGYVTFYLGILYNEDPSLIPWVDYFKEQLAK